MIYVKDNVFRDSKKFLRTADGRTIFNATPEDWLAEGWVEYVPEEHSSESKGKPIEELKEDISNDARNYRNTNFEISTSRENRMYLRLLAEDLIAAGYSSARIFDDREDEVDLKKFIDFCKEANKVEYSWKMTLVKHLENISNLKNEADIKKYDYTTGYSKSPELS